VSSLSRHDTDITGPDTLPAAVAQAVQNMSQQAAVWRDLYCTCVAECGLSTEDERLLGWQLAAHSWGVSDGLKQLCRLGTQ
jgi:hypothetical protein